MEDTRKLRQAWHLYSRTILILYLVPGSRLLDYHSSSFQTRDSSIALTHGSPSDYSAVQKEIIPGNNTRRHDVWLGSIAFSRSLATDALVSSCAESVQSLFRSLDTMPVGMPRE